MTSAFGEPTTGERTVMAAGDLPEAFGSTLACHGCGWKGSLAEPAVLRCPAADPNDGIDHVVVRVLDPAVVAYPGEVAAPEESAPVSPFVRYRTLLHAYHAACRLGCSDADFVGLVERLDREIARVDGHGFRVTPFRLERALSDRLRFRTCGGVWVKDETHNVSGSHKARHLFGTLLELEVADAVRAGECSDADAYAPAREAPPLAIASCGNAALAAAVVARAAGRRLDVFIPTDADPAVVARLGELGAHLEVCERSPGIPGDPTYLRLLGALAAGAVPFTCQGNLNGLAIEGGETLAWEMLDELRGGSPGSGYSPESGDVPRLDRLFVQVGGGALASAVIAGFDDACRLGMGADTPRIHAVQTHAAFPLARAYRLVADRLLGRPRWDPPDADTFTIAPSEEELAALQLVATSDSGRATLAAAAFDRAAFMWPWDSAPHSVAHGILDDETYDWFAVVAGMLETRGYPIVVDEPTLESANALARETTGIDVDHTGTSGLAGLIALHATGRLGAEETVAVLFTGVRRSAHSAPVASPTTAAARTAT